MSIRVLVCGDREWTDYEYIVDVLREIRKEYDGIECVIEGEARGADRLGRRAAEELGIVVMPFPADWKQYGRAAGPIRNRQMLDEGDPHLVLAFHDDLENSRGTKNMVEQALKRNVPVKFFSHQQTSEGE